MKKIKLQKSLKCIICNNKKFKKSFPYKTQFNKNFFFYYKCLSCKLVFIEPTPKTNDFKKMYDNKNYHKNFYLEKTNKEYKKNYIFIKEHIKINNSILDYGCGYGHFLNEIPDEFIKTGVEFDKKIIEVCRKKFKRINFITFKKFWRDNKKYDLIHLGDVLEHIPNPDVFLKKIIKKLKKKGFLFLVGPLERNISLVNYAFLIFGFLKNFYFSKSQQNFIPYHLFFFNLKNQLLLIKKITNLSIVKLKVYETGWPYFEGNFIKKIIAIFAICFAKVNIFGFKLGNRFKIILQKK